MRVQQRPKRVQTAVYVAYDEEIFMGHGIHFTTSKKPQTQCWRLIFIYCDGFYKYRPDYLYQRQIHTLHRL